MTTAPSSEQDAALSREPAAKGVTPLARIRNFSIVAHIDHGKSTLADRLIQICGGMTEREMAGQAQVLDSMDIEKERGITIKAQTVRLDYRAKDGELYQLNLMDTPGHVDFGYEVSRSLAACEGSLLVVDASQGVEAQTLANVYKALDNNHEIVPILNKIDLPAAEPDRVKQQIEDVIGLDAHDAVEISAKTGLNIDQVLEAIVHRLPPPKGDAKAPLKAMLIDSWYDPYLGVVVLVRVVDGLLRKGMRIKLMSTGAVHPIDRVGIFRPKQEMLDVLGPGEVGFFTAAIKEVADTRVGDTVTEDKRQTAQALPGFKPVQPVVFCGLFPVDASQFEDLRDAMSKLRLNDASFQYEMETSAALGFGFRCGFLGLLHLEIVRERLEREFNIDLITTAPSVIYRLYMTDGADARNAQSGRHARRGQDRPHGGAVDQGDHLRARRASRRGLEALRGSPRTAEGADLCRLARHGGLRSAAERGGVRFLRPAEIHQPRLCELRLFHHGLRARRPCENVDPRQRRTGGRALDDRPSRARRDAGPHDVREAEGADPPAHVQDPDPGGYRRQGDRARDAVGAAQGRDREVLWRRRDPQAQALDKQKEGKKKMRQFGRVEIPQEAFIAALKMDAN